MATVRKRAWTTPSGELREAWRCRYIDQGGITRTRQFDLKRDADAWRVKVEGELATGIHTADAASITIAQAAAAWITHVELKRRDRGTLKSYRELRDRHIVPLIGTVKLSRLTRKDVVAFRDALLSTRSTAMARKAVRALAMILYVAQEQGNVAQNVAASVKVESSSRDRKNKIAIPDKTHLIALLAGADHLATDMPSLPALIRTAMFAGIRSSELRGMAWPAVDFNAGTLTVSQRADRWAEIGAPKSDAGRRTIPIGPALVAELRRWKLRCPPSDLNLVFPNERGNAPSQHRIIAQFLAVQVAAGIAINSGQVDVKGAAIWKPRYGLHSLRHAAASAWIKQGIDLKRLQVWIGHATIQLTIDTYGHLITDAQADAALAGGAESALLA